MADVGVRLARPDDVEEIARIQVQTWGFAYASLLPATAFDMMTLPAARQAWAAAVRQPPSPRHRVLVALEQDWRVGFVASSPAEDLEPADPQPQTTLSIAALVVEPRWARRGHGSRLLAAAVDYARGDGMTRAIVWVPEQDTALREFYVSAGWAPDGLARGLDAGGGEVREIRLHTAIGD
jgi:GNAT superfamily N-acetyltransferase